MTKPNDGQTPGQSDGHADERSELQRRDFLKVAGASASALLLGSSNVSAESPRPKATRAVRSASASSEIVVIGAGGWGSFTALNLRMLGAKVTLVDAYGPGNARSTSGDESRGVRSSYGDRNGDQGELWMLWAREAMGMWKKFDDEWGRDLRLNLFHVTGDLIMRTEWDNFQLRCKVWWDKHKIPYEVLNPDDVRKAFPVMNIEDITAVLHEPDAGVVRARRGAQTAAAAFEHLGGKIVIGRATPSKISNGRLEEIALDTGATLRADTFVYCPGAWLGKTFPDLFAKKMTAPIGYVVYFGTPVGDHRFAYPNIPSYNFPGVTGWAALPVDNRGFRVRGAERAPATAPTAVDTTRAGNGRGGAGGGAAGGANRPVSTAGTATDVGSNAANAGAAASAGRGAGGGGGGGGGGFGRPQQDVPPAQQDPDTSDRWADQTRIDGSRRFVAHRFPLLKDAPVAQTHACHYEITSSGNFIIDKHPQWGNVWIAAGGNAEGFKFCPKIGHYVASRVITGAVDSVADKAFKIPEKEFPPPPPRDSTRTPPDSARRRP
jgi:glycine/D-amino acid oxidase-like deaminating enzyme